MHSVFKDLETNSRAALSRPTHFRLLLAQPHR